MSKIYKYTISGKEFSYDATDKEEKYLEMNREMTGVEPSDFISFYVSKYPTCPVDVALLNGFRDNVNNMSTIDNFSNIKLDLDYKNVKQNLSEATTKLDKDDDVIKKIFEEVRENQ